MPAINTILSRALGRRSVETDYLDLIAEAEENLSVPVADLTKAKSVLEATAQTVRFASVPVPERITAFDPILHSARESLRSLFEDRARRVEELEVFRMRSGLDRPPHDPNPITGALQVGAIGLIETAAGTGFLLTAGLAGGWAAAISTSVLLTVVNLGLSISAAFYEGRYCDYGIDAPDHNDPAFVSRRRRAKALTMLTIGGLGYMHLMLSAIRDQRTLDPEVSVDAFISALTTPEPLLMFLLGCVFSRFAWAKGMRSFSDPYPGYSERANALNHVDGELSGLLQELREQIQHAYDDELNALSRAKAELKSVVDTHRDARAQYLRCDQTLRNQVAAQETALRAQFGRVRSIEAMADGGHHDAPSELKGKLSLERFLPGDAPAPFQMPDFSDHERALLTAKSRALDELMRIYDAARSNQNTTGD